MPICDGIAGAAKGRGSCDECLVTKVRLPAGGYEVDDGPQVLDRGGRWSDGCWVGGEIENRQAEVENGATPHGALRQG